MKPKDEEIAEKELRLRTILFSGYVDRSTDGAETFRRMSLAARQLREYLHEMWREWAEKQPAPTNGKHEVKK